MASVAGEDLPGDDQSRAVRSIVESQFEALIVRFSPAGELYSRLFRSLTEDALSGPYHDGEKRFSAINLDGVPFQWSVSIGSRRCGLRFITEVGLAGASISDRVIQTRTLLDALAPSLLLENLPALDDALSCLLVDSERLNESLMGLCLGAEFRQDGEARLKVYVNGEFGTIGERYQRLQECLIKCRRPAALRQLDRFVATVGDRLKPAFLAVDLVPTGLGRIKLYLRPTDGSTELQELAADAIGCRSAKRALDQFHHTFLKDGDYPARSVDMCIEFPADGGAAGFKVDLCTSGFLSSDADVDRRVRRLLAALGGYSSTDYQIVRDVVVGIPSTLQVKQIVFVGLAARGDEHQVDVYFHPRPTPINGGPIMASRPNCETIGAALQLGDAIQP
jgi:hypothetical protein